MYRIGIMQGRLSPSIGGKIQSFPWDSWRDEFFIAKEIGLSSIEFIFDDKIKYRDNPLWSDESIIEIKNIVKETEVSINFICADYFMESPFFNSAESNKIKRIEILNKLITQSAKIGVVGIEIPFVDNSKMKTDRDIEEVKEVLINLIPKLEENKIILGLETSFEPIKFEKFLKDINHPLIRANYDTGNSASLGYSPRDEMKAYGNFVTNIHIKDRIFNGGTVALGTGQTNFDIFFQSLSECGYSGDFILQAARGEDGNEKENTKQQVKFLQDLINKYLE